MINRRGSNKRLILNNPLKGSLSIHKFQEKKVPNKTSLIKVNHISVNGFQFSSNLKFPIDSRIKLLFKLQLLGQTHDLYGEVVWRKQVTSKKFHYGVKLTKAQIGYIKTILTLTGELNNKNSRKFIEVS
ncbi:PilZ domain-containing protein [Bacillus sp. Marseille-P3661]|uniref:PilZ domain-containing protein n=1 Tax=Bacillus sp. Marseille-P3661 TaxID=1936234 RepID=UPI0015E17FD9|nr:PilZ domain-containing protein [Bacillus sp. Marseille-P3661]